MKKIVAMVLSIALCGSLIVPQCHAENAKERTNKNSTITEVPPESMQEPIDEAAPPAMPADATPAVGDYT